MDDIVSLFTSRGDQTTDKQLLDAIYHPPLQWGREPVCRRLRQLSIKDPSPQVKTAASERVRSFEKLYGPVNQ